MTDPQVAGLLFGVASHSPLPTGQAMPVHEEIPALWEVEQEERGDDFTVVLNPDEIL
jgi:hypothetical protein